MTKGLRRTLAAAVVLSLLGGGAATAGPRPAARHEPTRTLVLRYSHDGASPTALRVEGTVRVVSGAFIAFAQVDETHPRHPVVRYADVEDFDQAARISAYSEHGNVDVCPGLAVCVLTKGEIHFDLTAPVGPPALSRHLRAYIVIRAAHVRYRVGRRGGWVSRRTGGAIIRRTDARGHSTGVEAHGWSAGVTTSASAPGFRHGSVAIAPPPCEVGGAGALTLYGGARTVTAHCRGGAVGSVAQALTRWKVKGVAAGVTHRATRLVVLAR